METVEKTPLTKEERHRRALLATFLLQESQRRPDADLEKERADPNTQVGKWYAEFKALQQKEHP